MDLKAWRENRKGEKRVLPSGLVVKVRRCDLLDLAAQGQIPAPLAAMVGNLVTTGMTINMENFGEYATVVNMLVKACLIDPPVAEESDSDHIGLDELPMKDRIAIYNWANEGVAWLAPFREDVGEPEDVGRDSSEVRPEA